MTISLTRPISTETNQSTPPVRVAPADVWDLERQIRGAGQVSRVRTLDADNRKYAPVHAGLEERITVEERSIETHRDKAGAAIMGALFGIALIVGSAFGGAFSGDDAGIAPAEPGQQMAAVIQ